MKTRAVRRYDPPRYPTRQYLQEHPELLQCIPERWRQHRLVLGTLSMVVPLIVSRPAQAGDAQGAAATASRVAPLFIHGDGRGSFGCVAHNPPVFLSEDEARQVIQDEAKKAGVVFAAEALTLKGVAVPVTDRYGFLAEADRKRAAKEGGQEAKPPPAETQKRDLVLDGYDKVHNVAYEVVSPEDFAEWETKDHTRMATAWVYDFKATAETLAAGLGQAGEKTVIGVFYEPAARPPKMTYPEGPVIQPERGAFLKAQRQAARDLGEKELREQVRDFLAWLKAQGVI